MKFMIFLKRIVKFEVNFRIYLLFIEKNYLLNLFILNRVFNSKVALEVL